jgi:hypothetical protein
MILKWIAKYLDDTIIKDLKDLLPKDK